VADTVSDSFLEVLRPIDGVFAGFGSKLIRSDTTDGAIAGELLACSATRCSIVVNANPGAGLMAGTGEAVSGCAAVFGRRLTTGFEADSRRRMRITIRVTSAATSSVITPTNACRKAGDICGATCSNMEGLPDTKFKSQI
jgi:hypothetical protein